MKREMSEHQRAAAIDVIRILMTLTLDDAITVTSAAMAFVDRFKADDPEIVDGAVNPSKIRVPIHKTHYRTR